MTDNKDTKSDTEQEDASQPIILGNEGTEKPKEPTAEPTQSEAKSGAAKIQDESKSNNAEADGKDADLADNKVANETPVTKPEKAKENAPKEPKVPPVTTHKTSRSSSTKKTVFNILLFLFVLALMGLVAGAAYYVYNSVQVLAGQQDSKIILMQDQLSELDEKVITQKQTQVALQQGYKRELEQISKKLSAAEERLSAQNKRLLAMSTTSREDWLLAEAEYLLKLANQRVLIERNADSAIALLDEADAILRDLADPDLFSLRSAIHDDLAALKLAEKIDTEGLYLQLSALAKNVDSLPLVPAAYNFSLDSKEPASDSTEQAETEKSFWRFFNNFDRYVRVIDHSEKPEAILPPDQTAYLHLNLRLMIERAQIALLREQQQVYTSSLLDAEAWLNKYFPSSQTTSTFKTRVHELSEQKIHRDLPNISNSLNLLHGYIDTMHTLGSTKPTKTSPSNEANK